MWSLKGCTSQADGIFALIFLIAYLATFAPGMGPMPWTINSEIFPQNFRSTGVGITTMCNWVVNFLVSLTFLDLVDALTSYGAFWFYAGCGVLSFVFFYFMLPETKGLALEEIAVLFGKPKNYSSGSFPAEEGEAASGVLSTQISIDDENDRDVMMPVL